MVTDALWWSLVVNEGGINARWKSYKSQDCPGLLLCHLIARPDCRDIPLHMTHTEGEFTHMPTTTMSHLPAPLYHCMAVHCTYCGRFFEWYPSYEEQIIIIG